VIWALRQQVKQLSDLKAQLSDPGNTPNLLPELLVGITDLLSNLVTGTFIIEKQPPQVRLFYLAASGHHRPLEQPRHRDFHH
jgi:hypothetical protein